MEPTKPYEIDTVFYDGNCPLCSAEIEKLKACAGEAIECRDIHQLPDCSDLPNKEILLERLHLKTAEGNWLVGVDANVRAWKHTSYGRFLSVLTWPLVRVVSSLVYELWLRVRRRKSLKRES